MKTKQKNRALFKDTLHCEVQGDLSTVERKSLEGAFYLPSRRGRGIKMNDIYDLEAKEEEIRALMENSERQVLFIKQAFSGRNLTKNQQIDYIINHYQFEHAYLKRELNSLDSEIRAVKRATFNQRAIKWFPLLKELVDDVNFAALMDDPNRLKNAFIKISSALGIKVKKSQEEKKGEVVTVADIKKSLNIKIWIYKRNAKSIIQKKRRLKNPVGRMGPLKESTLKQYELMVREWDKGKDDYKKEIRELSNGLKEMKHAKMLKFDDGRFLTIHCGGKAPAV